MLNVDQVNKFYLGLQDRRNELQRELEGYERDLGLERDETFARGQISALEEIISALRDLVHSDPVYRAKREEERA